MRFTVPDVKEENKREYKINDEITDITVVAHKKSCFFCKHLSDIIYDYTNGPYGFCCEKKCYCKKAIYGKCKNFEEEKGERNYD